MSNVILDTEDISGSYVLQMIYSTYDRAVSFCNVIWKKYALYI